MGGGDESSATRAAEFQKQMDDVWTRERGKCKETGHGTEAIDSGVRVIGLQNVFDRIYMDLRNMSDIMAPTTHKPNPAQDQNRGVNESCTE